VNKQFESYCNYPIFVQRKMSRRMTCCARLSEDEKAVRGRTKFQRWRNLVYDLRHTKKRIPAAFIEAISQSCIV